MSEFGGHCWWEAPKIHVAKLFSDTTHWSLMTMTTVAGYSMLLLLVLIARNFCRSLYFLKMWPFPLEEVETEWLLS